MMGQRRNFFVGVVATALILGLISEAYGAPSNGLIDPLVVNGTSISIEDAPYQISLEFWRIHKCGGAIITKQHAVTAAHCVENSSEHKRMTVRVGSTIQIPLINFFGGVLHHIESIKLHPNFKNYGLAYDLAVITVRDDFEFTSRVQPIPVPPAGEGFIDYSKLATVSGWGKTSQDNWFSHWRLLKADIPMVTREECKKAYLGESYISDEYLCAGLRQTGSPCFGDSGGPLTHQNQLIGLVSWGRSCSHSSGYPSIYTNLLLDDIRDFITYVAKV